MIHAKTKKRLIVPAVLTVIVVGVAGSGAVSCGTTVVAAKDAGAGGTGGVGGSGGATSSAVVDVSAG